ncbi:hypothetical protein CLV58_109179 [Spirosoma oryzae]|uniref:Phage tail lysozyme domain-containing protein n=1 Tax=Spirosoma oryzae TaxID=1469603 RepID=A0A2T0SYF6_9BACT|nr:phage tail tip lysozyme [Spirosoma oryzae]PRY38452.1 hypothetical protein CLV58_109179 [Spirosoma oryzae]
MIDFTQLLSLAPANDGIDLSGYGFDSAGQQPVSIDTGRDLSAEPDGDSDDAYFQQAEQPVWDYDPTDDDEFVRQLLYQPTYRSRALSIRPASPDNQSDYSGMPGNKTGQFYRTTRNLSALDAFRYYTEQKGLAPHVAAGIVGNLQQESGFNPRAVGDSGTSHGLAQWHNERWQGLQQAARQQGRDPYDPYFQLDHVLSEPGESASVLNKLNQTRTASEAARVFGRSYERYNPVQANEAGRAAYARRLHGEPSSRETYQDGGLITGLIGQVAGQVVNYGLEKIFNPTASSVPAINGFIQQQLGQGNVQDQQLRAYRNQQEDELSNPATYQQGGMSPGFNQLRAYKPQLVGGIPLSAAGATDWKTSQLQKFGFSYNQDNTGRELINYSMKTLGNNVTGKAYGNDPLKPATGLQPVQPAAPQQQAPVIKAPTGWLDALLNPGIPVAVQAASALALNGQAQQQRALEWNKLKDLPYQKVRAAQPITGTAQPLYARYGYNSYDC